MHRLTAALALVLASNFLTAAHAQTRPDILIADFEAENYGAWTATGTAFGKAPARGTLPGQMQVEGFQGKGLVNSFAGGDDAIGTLTSPAFKIERKHLNFLIGGGGWKDETCLQLRVAGKIVRTKAGPNTNAGGSERLDWASFDIAEFEGKEATLEIIDTRKGGWGHINVDQITQSDTKKEVGPAKLRLEVGGRYLRLPSKRGAPGNRLKVTAGDKLLVDCDIQLAEDPKSQPFLYDLEKNTAAGEAAPDSVEVEIARLASDSPLRASAWNWFTDDANDGLKDLVRPRFHFTAQRGWLNDPNGLVYHDGKYHLYFQHNPFGSEWGNMHWGHAVSTDLINWKELPIAIAPPKHGDWAFSGSAMIDTENRSGWGTKENPPIVAAWTSTGRGECISYSTDGGMTFKEYAGNPVVKHQGRDPRILWHEESKQFVMAVYNESEGKQWIAFHNSPDLKKWTFASKIEGYFECPELFPIHISQFTGPPPQEKWVLYAADGEYVVGEFDGKQFTPETKKQRLWHGNFYASQTFSNSRVGRIQIGWARGIDSHSQVFNQQMNLPVELMLVPAASGLQLFAKPVPQVESLRGQSQKLGKFQLSGGDRTLASCNSKLLDLECELKLSEGVVELDVLGNQIRFAPEEKIVECQGVKAPFAASGQTTRLRVLLDTHSIEVFMNGGVIAIAAPAAREKSGTEIRLRTTKDCELVGGAVHELLATPVKK